MRRTHLLAAAALATGLAACGQGPRKSGPVVAKGDGITITAGELKARLEEQSPFIRARYNTLERKKEFLDNLIRFELLAKAAEKEGLDKDPDVQLMLRKVMVQKLVQKTFQEGDPSRDPSKEVPEADARKFYEDHQSDYVVPRKVRLAQILVAAPGGPTRPQKEAQAKKVLARARAEEKKNALAFAGLARELSDDQITKNTGGDLGFKAQAEMERQYGKAFADQAFALPAGGLAVLESPQGFHVVKQTGTQEAVDRSFDSVKSQIVARLFRERRAKSFEEFVKKLRDEAHVTVNDAELEKVTVAAGPPPTPGMMGPGPGGMNPHAPLLGQPAHPVVTPAPPPPAQRGGAAPVPTGGAAPPPAPSR